MVMFVIPGQMTQQIELIFGMGLHYNGQALPAKMKHDQLHAQFNLHQMDFDQFGIVSNQREIIF